MYFFYYYPVGVNVPRPRVPVATLVLGLSMLGIFLVTIPFDRQFQLDWGQFVYRAAAFNALTPLTACFLHGGWMHLAGNLIYLWVFGPALEKALGSWGFLLVFCGTGYIGNLTQGAVTVHYFPEQAWAGVVGASGAISGMLGLFMLRYYYAKIKLAYWAFLPLQGINRTGTVLLPVAVGLAIWVTLQVTLWWVERGGGSTAYGAHIGGLLTGLVLAFFLGQASRGQLEYLLERSRRFRHEANLHAAVGSLEKYLERAPWDREVWLEYARTLQMNNDWGKAQAIYRRLLSGAMDKDRFQEAVEIYGEARRGNGAFVLPVSQQRRLAFWLEKSTHFHHAVSAYLDLARVYPEHPDREHALARAATLMITRLNQTHEGLELLDEAIEEFPHGHWRPLLEAERRKILGPSHA